MRYRPVIWLVVGLLCLAVFLRLDRRLGSEASPLEVTVGDVTRARAPLIPSPPEQSTRSSSLQGAAGTSRRVLSNTGQSLGELLDNPRAILLENALLDTTHSIELAIPNSLRSPADPRAYVVQATGAPDENFRKTLAGAGATMVSYVPNNAYLVRASAEVIEKLRGQHGIQAVLPFEPYYKLKGSLLDLALDSIAAELPIRINILLFADAHDEAHKQVAAMGAQVLGDAACPFGPVLHAICPSSALPRLAGLPGVQEIEPARDRVAATDLSRTAIGIAMDATTTSNYLGLTGAGVLVSVNDSGVDAAHPDLHDRVMVNDANAALDPNGHGTHIAGVIAGDGASSLTVSGAPGSVMPPRAFQFRGMASAARIFAQKFNPDASWPGAEASLFQPAAATNATISNNSWVYANDNDYDIAAANCDAAVRDALQRTSGSQPLLCVFAAGNSGNGSDDGHGGIAGSIQSPATAKNVISVGALEHPRFITNQTWTCTNANDCRTNIPWLGATDAGDRVAAFSSRGNVGAGIEGPFGRFKPDVVAPGVFVLAARSTQWDRAAAYSSTNPSLFGPRDANYFEVLSNLDNSAGPFYRFESGTSVAAAEVSGTLALMQEFFQFRLRATNSPALTKALLINGARPAGTNGFNVNSLTNSQGWGIIDLPNSLPPAQTNPVNSSMFFLDQSPSRALATGESRTETVWVRPEARNLPLRATLAWTDPPANPLAGIKLVNDLNLIVTNLDTGTVFYGNDIAPDSRFNSARNPGLPPGFDAVNNVENVFLAPPLSGRYSLTVMAKRVNVNAVTAHTGVAQDYALVVSSGNGEIPDGLTLDEYLTGTVTPRIQVVKLTNQFSPDSLDFGCILPGQRIGAGSALLSTNAIPLPWPAVGQISIGISNQWRFYMLTNELGFTNAAFVTFLSRSLALDGAGRLRNLPVDSGQADIDLYVSQDSALTNLDPVTLANADKSLGRGGCETILYSNAAPGVYYLGVKCESAAGAEYTLMASLSDTPYAQTDGAGNTVLRGFPSAAGIPAQGTASVMCVLPDPMFVRRVLVTNTLTHPQMVDITAVLMRESSAVALLNHTANAPGGELIFDDSDEGDVAGARHSAGPGTLDDFAGPQAAGQWRLALASTNQPGTNENLWVSLEPAMDTSGTLISVVLPFACRRDFFSVPSTATNLSTTYTLVSGSGPVAVQLYPLGSNPGTAPAVALDGSHVNGFLVVDNTSVPPLIPGVYEIRVCNSGADSAAVRIATSIATDPRLPEVVQFTSDTPVDITDDAVSTSTIDVTSTEQIAALNVGVRLDHPRVSDLVLRLVSPAGTRVLLQENRGGLSTEGMGTEIMVTNRTTISWSGGPEAFTNTLETGQRSGTVSIDYDFYQLPDQMTVYYENTLLLDTGLTSGSGQTNLSYGPGNSTFVTIVMNEHGNPDLNTAWYYNATSTRIAPFYVTFTENTNFASVPIKFAIPPFTNANYSAPGSKPDSGIFYFPEESLGKLTGESANGAWALEIEDTRAGGTNGSCKLLSWDLEMVLRSATPAPVPMSPGSAFTNSIGPGQMQWFAVDAPEWVAFATNQILFASVTVNLLFNPSVPPTGTNALDAALLSNSTRGTVVLQTNGSPALLPGRRYFLAIQNTNNSAATFGLRIDFDLGAVATLQNAVPYMTNVAGMGVDYYRVLVSASAVRAQFEVNSLGGDLTLWARKGLPLPSENRYDYLSANPGTNDELIVVYDFSPPVPLSPGEWFLGVVNPSPQPVGYTVNATLFADTGTNLFIVDRGITNQNFCLTWNSLPGVHYFIQGKTSLTDAGWITVSPGLTATDNYSTYCVPLPSPFQFFRVSEGLVLAFPPPEISTTRLPDGQVRLHWLAPPGNWFAVQCAESLDDPDWVSFSRTVFSATEDYEFVDDGSEFGYAGQNRFYRLVKLP